MFTTFWLKCPGLVPIRNVQTFFPLIAEHKQVVLYCTDYYCFLMLVYDNIIKNIINIKHGKLKYFLIRYNLCQLWLLATTFILVC